MNSRGSTRGGRGRGGHAEEEEGEEADGQDLAQSGNNDWRDKAER